MSYKLGVIGFGNIAKAIITPLLDKQILKSEEIFCVVNSKNSCEHIKKNYSHNINISYASSKDSVLVWDCPLKLLSIKPQQLKNINELIPKNGRENFLISVLAGISLNKLQEIFPNHKCVRAVTNIPITIGKGLTGISWSEKIDDKTKILIKNIFESSSKVYEFAEDYLDVFLALTSSAPAIVALIIEAFSDGGLNGGLPKRLSEELVLEMILGTVLMIKDLRISTYEFKNMVTSPAGTTISALRVLEKEGFKSALIESILAATNRSKQFN